MNQFFKLWVFIKISDRMMEYIPLKITVKNRKQITLHLIVTIPKLLVSPPKNLRDS